METYSYSWIRSFNIFEMSNLAHQICRLKKFTVKFQHGILQVLTKTILKFCSIIRPRVYSSNTVLRNKSEFGRHTLPELKITIKRPKTTGCWWKNRHKLKAGNGDNRKKSQKCLWPRNDLWQRAKTIQCRKNSVFNRWHWKNWEFKWEERISDNDDTTVAIFQPGDQKVDRMMNDWHMLRNLWGSITQTNIRVIRREKREGGKKTIGRNNGQNFRNLWKFVNLHI